MEAVVEVLLDRGGVASFTEIYDDIVRRELFVFNTPTPEHVLRTTIRRHAENMARSDSRDLVYFTIEGDDQCRLVNQSGEGVIMKKKSATGMKRIHRASDREQIIKELMSDKVGAFKEIWRLLLFAAQVGFAHGKRIPLKSIDPGKGIDQSTFGNSPSWPGLCYLMALVESDDSDALVGTAEAEEARLSVFQEYANGGLGILQAFFSERPVDLDGWMNFLESQEQKAEKMPDLEINI